MAALPISKVKVVIIIIQAKVHINVFSFSLAYFIPKDRLLIFPNVKKNALFHLLYFAKVNEDEISDIMKLYLYQINLQDFKYSYKSHFYYHAIHQ